jgi:hypothetical protein
MRSAAQELAAKLRDRELALDRVGPALDTGRAVLMRRTRAVVDSYASAFARWSTEDVPTPRKAREQSEFLSLVPFVRALLVEDL